MSRRLFRNNLSVSQVNFVAITVTDSSRELYNLTEWGLTPLQHHFPHRPEVLASNLLVLE